MHWQILVLFTKKVYCIKMKASFLLSLILSMQRNIIKKPNKNNLEELLITLEIFLFVKTLIIQTSLKTLISKKALSIYLEQDNLVAQRHQLTSVNVI